MIPTHIPTHIPTISDLSDRAMFRLSGPDAQRYLNGQITQDVRLATEEKAVYSVVTNFKGKLEGDCFIRRHEGDILIDTSSDQRESLFARLDKYLIADDAELVDITGSLTLYFSTDTTNVEAQGWSINRYGVDAIDILGTPEHADPAEAWETIRILNGVPAWGAELTNTILPAEASLEQSAVSYTKGCYTGQEVISRMKSAAKKNNHLVQLKVENKISTPTPFFQSLEDKKPSGNLTSITQIGEEWIGLGYRTRKVEEETEFITEDGQKVSIEI